MAAWLDLRRRPGAALCAPPWRRDFTGVVLRPGAVRIPAEQCFAPRAATFSSWRRRRRAAHAAASVRPCSGARPHALPACGARRGPCPRKAHAPASAAPGLAPS